MCQSQGWVTPSSSSSFSSSSSSKMMHWSSSTTYMGERPYNKMQLLPTKVHPYPKIGWHNGPQGQALFFLLPPTFPFPRAHTHVVLLFSRSTSSSRGFSFSALISFSSFARFHFSSLLSLLLPLSTHPPPPVALCKRCGR